jgi:putative transposase
MRHSRFSHEKIALLLRDAERADSVDDFCRAHGISVSLLYDWRKKYSGLEPEGIRRLRELERENKRLNGVIAILSSEIDKLRADDRTAASSGGEDAPAAGL